MSRLATVAEATNALRQHLSKAHKPYAGARFRAAFLKEDSRSLRVPSCSALKRFSPDRLPTTESSFSRMNGRAIGKKRSTCFLGSCQGKRVSQDKTSKRAVLFPILSIGPQYLSEWEPEVGQVGKCGASLIPARI